MQYTIRPALRQDLPAIVDIYNSTVATRQSTADLSPTTVAEREMWFAAHTDKRPIYALYDADGTVLAWGSFSDYHRATPTTSAQKSAFMSATICAEQAWAKSCCGTCSNAHRP